MVEEKPVVVGGDGAPLSIFLIVIFLHILHEFLEHLKKRGLGSSEQIKLRQEIKQLLKEANSLSTPSTFAQAAKLRRTAAAKEKELMKKQGEENKENKMSFDMYARALLVFKVCLYTGLTWRFWSDPVAAVPQQLLQPFGRVLSWRGSSGTGLVTVGIIPWLVITSRVSKFACQKVAKIVSSR
ncbi:uncharacterized protein M6B38_324365 [Iris pallida]|uniref:Tail-anchored protein insertion receptor WRB n=1 Tax=Iris pallida TaxID=29817 RepID=A0AAX6H7W0_IRIPA|nr:uncharacterized protein M6B38_194330 [Iris pallida]KAJ6836814.1 uncharacterized protein M6B38_324365 [Iris pallida]